MSPASFVAAANEAGDPQVIPCGNGKMVINLEILGCWGVYFETNPCDPCGQIVGPRDFCLVFWFILDHTCG